RRNDSIGILERGARGARRGSLGIRGRKSPHRRLVRRAVAVLRQGSAKHGRSFLFSAVAGGESRQAGSKRKHIPPAGVRLFHGVQNITKSRRAAPRSRVRCSFLHL